MENRSDEMEEFKKFLAEGSIQGSDEGNSFD
jgi:hypothetical protein